MKLRILNETGYLRLRKYGIKTGCSRLFWVLASLWIPPFFQVASSANGNFGVAFDSLPPQQQVGMIQAYFAFIGDEKIMNDDETGQLFASSSKNSVCPLIQDRSYPCRPTLFGRDLCVQPSSKASESFSQCRNRFKAEGRDIGTVVELIKKDPEVARDFQALSRNIDVLCDLKATETRKKLPRDRACETLADRLIALANGKPVNVRENVGGSPKFTVEPVITSDPPNEIFESAPHSLSPKESPATSSSPGSSKGASSGSY